MASEYEFEGPGVVKPHPKKNWVNPDARQVHFASGDGPRRGGGPKTDRAAPVQLFAGLMGLVFLLIGVAGFIPGVTSPFADLSAYGTDSRADLLDLFRVSVLHNIVHLLFAVGLLAAAKASWARLYLIGGGVAYLAVAAYGFLVEETSDANFLPLNDADNLLHVGLSLLMILLAVAGIAAERRSAS